MRRGVCRQSREQLPGGEAASSSRARPRTGWPADAPGRLARDQATDRARSTDSGGPDAAASDQTRRLIYRLPHELQGSTVGRVDRIRPGRSARLASSTRDTGERRRVAERLVAARTTPGPRPASRTRRGRIIRRARWNGSSGPTRSAPASPRPGEPRGPEPTPRSSPRGGRRESRCGDCRACVDACPARSVHRTAPSQPTSRARHGSTPGRRRPPPPRARREAGEPARSGMDHD